MVELMTMMVEQNKAYVLLDNQDVLGYLMPTVASVRAMLSPEAVQYADDKPVDSSSSTARSLVLVVMDLRVQKPLPPPPQQQQQSTYRQDQQYQQSAHSASAHGSWSSYGLPMLPPQMSAAALGYPPTQGSVLSHWGQSRQVAPQPPPPGPHSLLHAPPPPYAFRGAQSSASWGGPPAPNSSNPGAGHSWANRRY
jgi:hypothetical protein